MQTARNFFLTREKEFVRKIKEIFIALHIESLMSKDEILTLYLNKIPLGHRSFGIGAAAQVYYGKELKELTLAQLATIAGLPKAPSTLNPISNPERSRGRRNVVLYRMFVEGYITQQQFDEARMAPVTAKRHSTEIEFSAPYISELIRAEMVERFGLNDAYNEGYRVFATVNSNNQAAAQTAVMKNIHEYDQRHGFRGVQIYLWNSENEPAWQRDDILNYLDTTADIGYLKAAVVEHIDDQNAYVALKSGESVTINWQGLKWARPYISHSRQGKAPATTADILLPGAFVWLQKTDDDQYKLSQMPDVSSAIVSLNPQDGAIHALVGGYSFDLSQFNRATQAKRQVGSNIKPFLYSAALNNGYNLASIINDAPINRWNSAQQIAWRPENSPPNYDGPIRIRRALAQSKNVVAVRLLRSIGARTTVDHLLKFGFSPEDIKPHESLSLGAASLTPLEVARGMAAFANGGHLIEPYLIDRIEDADGNILFKAQPLVVCNDCTIDEVRDSYNYAPRIISEQNAFLIADAMKTAIYGEPGWVGTGWRAKRLKRNDLSGKTGTTNDMVDTWFSGFNHQVITTTWVGFDDPGKRLGRVLYNRNLTKNQFTGGESGARTAQPVWINYMKQALAGMPNEPIEQPQGLVSLRIDKKTGLLSRESGRASRFEYFEKDSAPKQYLQEEVPNLFNDTDPNEELATDEELF
jgi:penicillin-binding protein 1A